MQEAMTDPSNIRAALDLYAEGLLLFKNYPGIQRECADQIDRLLRARLREMEDKGGETP